MAVTLKDVAKEAGVHVSTASRALNPATRSVVNGRTAGRVLAVAKRMGYRPHPMARGLRTNRTFSVGMVVPDLMNPQFAPMYAGAESVLSEYGYSLLILEAKDHSDDDWVAALLSEHRVDGLILGIARLDMAPPPELSAQGVPAVLLNRSTDAWPFSSIVGDDHAGIGLAVRHLHELGHRQVAHIAGPATISTGLNRRQAFVAWMISVGLEVSTELIVEADAFTIEAGRKAISTLMDTGADFTAVVAANDLLALGCMDELHERGRTVPDDVSLVGYNNMNFIDRVTPPLTTVSVDYREMGASAARSLLDVLSSHEPPVQTNTSIRFSPKLIVRSSTSQPQL